MTTKMMKKKTNTTQALVAKTIHKASKAPDYRVCQEAMKDARVFQEMARWGRAEINIAESEMPGLMALRKEYGKQQPLKGARINAMGD